MLTAALGVLGSMLIDDRAVGPMLQALEPEDFTDAAYRRVFETIRDLYAAGRPVDAILVNEALGGAYGKFLAELMDATPTAANADAYAEALKRTSRLVRLRELGAAIHGATEEAEVRALVDRANMLLCEMPGVRRLTMPQAYADFAARKDGKTRPDYLTWGFADLDEIFNVGQGDFVVIGGYPSAGKTAFGLQLAFHQARRKRVGFFSYETAADKLFDRTVAAQTDTSYSAIMGNRLKLDDFKRIAEHAKYLTEPTLELLETIGMTVSDIGAYAMAHHYDVVYIDYLQKIPAASDRKYTSDYERVSQVSSDLQQLGRRTGKTIVALSQLSRADKKGGSSTPTMSSLRQSGQIEQDADVVMLLYKEDPKDYRSRRVLDFAKNKDGRAGYGMLLNFDGDKQLFSKSLKQPKPERKEPPAQRSLFAPDPSDEATPFDEEARS
jgi:replicative DNA helicase